MRARERVGTLLADRRQNAAVGWLLVAFLVVVAVQSVLGGDLIWAGFVAAIVVLALVPPVGHRDPTTMLPWEVIALAALPTFGRVLATVELTSDLATYLSVAAVALIIAVELHAFTEVRMTYGFAIAFVVVATMATAGVWAVVRWASDTWLGTAFLLEAGVSEAAVERAVMWEFVYSTVAGVLAGLIFELYFRRRAPIAARLHEEAVENG